MKLWVDGERFAAVGEGNGPVNALDVAVRAALNGRYPALERIHLTDFKVRVLDGGSATGAVVRVLIDSTDGENVVDHRRRSTPTSSRRRGRRWSTRSSTGCCTPRRIGSPSMAAPEYVPRSPTDKPRVYRSPPWSGDSGWPTGPASSTGRQPLGPRLGYPGPDQGFVLKLARALRAERWCWPRASRADDVIAGCGAVALKRASLFGRAPVVHDLTVAFTDLGLPGPGRRRAVAAAAPAVRGGGQPAPLHGAARRSPTWCPRPCCA